MATPAATPVEGLMARGKGEGSIYREKSSGLWAASIALPADPVTGRAPHAWGRAVGWYMVALADSLELNVIRFWEKEMK